MIPAAGKATRIAPLPCSKELYPIGFRKVGKHGEYRPKVVCHYLLEKMRLADVSKVYIVLRKGKWDIPEYLGDGEMFGLSLSYLMMRLSFGVPYTLDQAYPFLHDARVVFGFPDIMFQPDNAFSVLLDHQAKSNCDIVLGLFTTDQPHKWDMVDLDLGGSVRQIIVKPSNKNDLKYCWAIAVWNPEFTGFMHQYVVATEKNNELLGLEGSVIEHQEIHLGHVIQAAVDSDFKVEGVRFPNQSCLDIGTPDGLTQVFRY